MNLIRSKGGDLVTCVECGAQMGTSKLCEKCGAPLVEATPAQTVDEDRAQPWMVGIVIGGMDLLCLWGLFSFVRIFVTQGSPANAGHSYMPLWALLIGVVCFGGLPVLSVIYSIRWLRRRARERRALASEAPVLLPKTLD